MPQATGPSSAGDRSGADNRTVLLHIVLLVVAVRVWLQVLGLLSQGPGDWLDLWVRWDAAHLLRVAEVGYRAAGEEALYIVFLPGYPLGTALVGLLTRDLAAAGLLISLASSIGAGWMLYRLQRLDAPHEVAWRAVLILFTFPTAYFLLAPYSQSLYLFALLAAVYAARRGRWARAGLAGAVATGTRIVGVVAPAVLLVEAWRQRREGSLLRSVGWLALAPLGFAAYLALNLAVHGDPLAFVEIQRAQWRNRPAPPWFPLVTAVKRLSAGGLSEDMVIIHTGRLLATLVAVGLLLGGRRHLRAADQVYGWLALLLLLSSTWLISLPRYLLGLYPLFMAAAWLTRKPWALWATVGLGLGAQTWLFWRYANGWWTF